LQRGEKNASKREGPFASDAYFLGTTSTVLLVMLTLAAQARSARLPNVPRKLLWAWEARGFFLDGTLLVGGETLPGLMHTSVHLSVISNILRRLSTHDTQTSIE
jgi:hypothetical protein